jgi:hypothetical protein
MTGVAGFSRKLRYESIDATFNARKEGSFFSGDAQTKSGHSNRLSHELTLAGWRSTRVTQIIRKSTHLYTTFPTSREAAP